MTTTRKYLPNKCSGCTKRIRSRYMCEALGKLWHERCLRCDVCDEILYSFGDDNFYVKEDRKLCKIDYMRMYVPGGKCSKCDESIPSTEKVIKFKNNTSYHLSCFYCVFCRQRFCVGDVVKIPKPKIILCIEHQIENVEQFEYILREQEKMSDSGNSNGSDGR